MNGNWWGPNSAVVTTPVAPTDIALSKNIISSGAAVGDLVGTLTAMDVNSGETFTYSLPNGSSEFAITGNQLKVSGTLTAGTKTVKIMVKDKDNLTYSEDFTITITDATGTVNLVPGIGWEPNVDALGSSVAIDSSSVENGTVIGTCNTVKDTAYESYSSLAAYLDTNLTGSTILHLSYTATKDFWLSLDNGKDGFGVVLKASENKVDLVLNNTVFKKPSWSTATDAFNLAAISGFSFDPVTDDDDVATAAVSGKITITNLSIDGYIGNSTPIISSRKAVSTSAPMVKGMTTSNITLSAPKAGVYTVALYGLNGRLIHTATASLTVGMNNLPWDGASFGKSMSIVRVSGNGFATSQKSFIK